MLTPSLALALVVSWNGNEAASLCGGTTRLLSVKATAPDSASVVVPVRLFWLLGQFTKWRQQRIAGYLVASRDQRRPLRCRPGLTAYMVR
jgi:hypothetical protein